MTRMCEKGSKTLDIVQNYYGTHVEALGHRGGEFDWGAGLEGEEACDGGLATEGFGGGIVKER